MAESEEKPKRRRHSRSDDGYLQLPNRNPKHRAMRAGYRGFMLFSDPVENCIRCIHISYSRKKLEKLGLPGRNKDEPVIWPGGCDDFAGAQALIDQIIAKDTASLRGHIARFPLVDLGVEAFCDTVDKDNGMGQDITRKVLRESIVNGFIFRVELEHSSLDKTRRVVASIYQGHSRIAHKTLARGRG